MEGQKNTTKESLAVLSGPLAVGATVLMFALVLLEYFRHGFVSNFLDLRYFVGLVVVFWTTNVMTASEQKNSIFQKIIVLIILIFALYVIINLSLPFGRLGLIVIAVSVLVTFATAYGCLKSPPTNN